MFSNALDTVEVTLTLADGTILSGKLPMGTSSTIQGILGYNAPFLEFTSKDGRKRFIAKQSIAIVEPMEQLAKPVLDPKH
ncbi:MAG: hypothetical protein WBC71_07285 [Salaquimonas sp.]